MLYNKPMSSAREKEMGCLVSDQIRNARALVQKRLRREKRSKRKLLEQLEMESKRRSQLEEALKCAEKLSSHSDQKRESTSSSSKNPTTSQTNMNHISPIDRERDSSRNMMVQERLEREREENATTSMPSGVHGYPQGLRDSMPNPAKEEMKPWPYSGMDLMNTGAAFWQNYSDSLAQELELERKSRQQHVERDVKSPLQERGAYYKNSVLFTSSAT
ncbi:unnamed protein product [Brassicogethes aeneus]|uniref:Dachshund n=1 Tax=Brassicogethes aeneus TaxID=1431903 RepID=A0A9P0BBW3_BRAAE|nr:unnamed protein product [Brassicogethes aeneus]